MRCARRAAPACAAPQRHAHVARRVPQRGFTPAAPPTAAIRLRSHNLKPPRLCAQPVRCRWVSDQAKPRAGQNSVSDSSKPSIWTRYASAQYAQSGSHQNSRIRTRIEKDSPYPAYSREWWTDKLIVFTVFGVTGTRAAAHASILTYLAGSTTMYFVRPLLTNVLHLDGAISLCCKMQMLIPMLYQVVRRIGLHRFC